LNRKRFILIALCASLILNIFITPSSAYERKQHDEVMMTILFRKFDYARTDGSVQDELGALTSACYLAIDQFNSYGQKDLDVLEGYGVKNLPKGVSEIGYSASGRNHRDFTHRGWDFSYTGDMKTIWPARQDVLRNTVSKVFGLDVEDKQLEAFCELLYYIHIIGDHQDDESYKISNGRKIDVGGRHDSQDIIHKLLDAFKILFKDQLHSHKYIGLTTNLQQIDSKLDKLINSEGGINTEEKFQEHQALVDDLIEILSLYVPEMLKKEAFFNKVFYQHITQDTIFDWLNGFLKAV